MKKLVLSALAIVCALLIGCAGPAAPAAVTPPLPTPEPVLGIHVTQTNAPLRVSGSETAAVLKTLPADTPVSVLSVSNGMAHAKTETGLFGYTAYSCLVPSSVPFNETPVERVLGAHTAVGPLNAPVYNAPENGLLVWTLIPGDQVTVKKYKNELAFIVIGDSDVEGWVNAACLYPGTVEQETGEIFTIVDTGTPVLRKTPSRSGEEICTLASGDIVEVLGYHGPFARVRVQDQVGYLLSGILTKPLPAFSVVKPTDLYTYTQMLSDIDALCERFPDTARSVSIGQSVLGRELPVLILGDESAQTHFLICAGTHGREHMTPLLVMAQADALLSAGVPENTCYHIVPMLNPDGVSIAQGLEMTEDLQAIYQSDLKQRRTKDDETTYFSLFKANAAGVDLNRNFDAGFGNGQLRDRPSYAVYPGKHPADQPESKALVVYTEQRPYKAVLTYHSTGSLLYWAYEHKGKLYTESEALTQLLHGQTRYLLEPPSGGSGGYKDYVMEKLGIPAVTIEVGTRMCPLPAEEFVDIYLRNQNILPSLAGLN
ncbi:MAG: hypothetical protein IJP30_03690 [Clostridia bacterium]|nr:hypothetical protein [Clostridia bacterium]